MAQVLFRETAMLKIAHFEWATFPASIARYVSIPTPQSAQNRFKQCTIVVFELQGMMTKFRFFYLGNEIHTPSDIPGVEDFK